MILRSSLPSPFGRKVKIVAKLTGLMPQITVEMANVSDPADPVREQNPLVKIPVLILDDGTCLYDSHVICEYLDALHDGRKLFPSGYERWPALTLSALGDGIIEAALLQVYEKRMRPEERWHQEWVDYQANKVTRSLAHLEKHLPESRDTNIGHITLACALGYLDFRFDCRWRKSHPRLETWLDGFGAEFPAFKETTPRDAH